MGRDFWSELPGELRAFPREHVLEDDTAEHHRHRGGDLPDEAKGASCYRDIVARNVILQGDKRGLEVRANTDACNQLVDDDLGPFGVVWEIDEEPETKSHEYHAEPDRFLVPARLLYEDSHNSAADGQGDD